MKLLDGHAGIADQRPQKTSSQLVVIGHRERSFLAHLGEDHVTAAPADQRPPGALKSFGRRSSRDNRQPTHEGLNGDGGELGVVAAALALGLRI